MRNSKPVELTEGRISEYEKPDENLPTVISPLVSSEVINDGAVRFDPSNTNAVPLVATLLPFKYNTPLAVPPLSVRLPERVCVDPVSVVMLAEAMLRLLMTRLVSVRLVMLAEVADKCVRVAEPARSTVAEASDETRFVMDPEVAIRLVIVALEAVRFVTEKLLVPKSAM